jgi:hypothetical protein
MITGIGVLLLEHGGREGARGVAGCYSLEQRVREVGGNVK